ncbi:MAG: peptide deformylase [Chloroflexi bacterium]|nr:peptide deformylase [Chloroflexota bacterium]
MIRQIRKIGDLVLRKKAVKVEKISKETQKLVDDMIDTMHHAHGLGLAAPQIGVSQRVAVVEMSEHDEHGQEKSTLYTLINPEIVRKSEEIWEHAEGCLSIPGWRGDVERPLTITVKALDRLGARVRFEATGMLARAIQHELDHLDGVLYIDKLVAPDRVWQVNENEDKETA